jgi:hypothetical protein
VIVTPSSRHSASYHPREWLTSNVGTDPSVRHLVREHQTTPVYRPDCYLSFFYADSDCEGRKTLTRFRPPSFEA